MYRNLILTLHIAAASGWLGCNLTQLFLTPWFARRTGEAATAWFEATAVLARRYYNVVGAVLVVTGILLVLHTGYEFSSGFVGVGFAMAIFGGAMGALFFAPDGDRLAAASRSGARPSIRRYVLGVCLDTTLVLLTVLAMVSRWRA